MSVRVVSTATAASAAETPRTGRAPPVTAREPWPRWRARTAFERRGAVAEGGERGDGPGDHADAFGSRDPYGDGLDGGAGDPSSRSPGEQRQEERPPRGVGGRWPRALLVSLDEETPPASVHPNRRLNLDRFLGLLREVGLGLPAAPAARRHLSLLVQPFALVVDGPAGRAGDDRNTVVPGHWLSAHADLDIPTLQEAAALPLPGADEEFDEVVAAVVARIRDELSAD